MIFKKLFKSTNKNNDNLSPNQDQATHNEALKKAGIILMDYPEKITEAIDYFQRVIAIEPASAEYYWRLGKAYLDWGKPDEAIPALEQACTLEPNAVVIYLSLAWAFYLKNELTKAKALLEQIIEHDHDYLPAHGLYSMLLLKLGNYQQGWHEYEYRWKLDLLPVANIYSSYRRWKIDESIAGKTILLHSEQGFGDSLQFIRYVPLVAMKGARIILHCEPQLMDLFKSVEGVTQMTSINEPPPPFDVYCPLMSLPLQFNTAVETIPAKTPYIKADVIKSEYWRNKISCQNRALKVGLVWRGSDKRNLGTSSFYFSKRRGMKLNQFFPLSTIENVIFYSLQKNASTDEVQNCSFKLIDYTNEFNNFSDTAALINELDLVISTCTAVPHLAAAMGKPTWILLHSDSCWRWLTERSDSPWHPTVRLFRQEKAGDWDSIIAKVKSALSDFTKSISN